MVRYTILILAVMLVAAGCATGGSPSLATESSITDVSKLAGNWSGQVDTKSPSFYARAVVVIRPDGTFTAKAISPQAVEGVPIADTDGSITVKDGKARYQTMPGRPAGVFFGTSGTLLLSERGGKRVLDGTGDDGNVKFQFTAAK